MKEFLEKYENSFWALAALGIFLMGASFLISTVSKLFSEGILEHEKFKQFIGLFENTTSSEIIAYGISLVILVLITLFSFQMTSEILESRNNDELRKRADKIALIVGLITVFILFQQNYLESMFNSFGESKVLETIFGISGAGAGWLVWYLKHLEKYGELFHIKKSRGQPV